VAEKRRGKRHGSIQKQTCSLEGCGGIKLQELQNIPARDNKSLSSIAAEAYVQPSWLGADAANFGKHAQQADLAVGPATGVNRFNGRLS
jgi:cell wall assembly regulator SMI1